MVEAEATATCPGADNASRPDVGEDDQASLRSLPGAGSLGVELGLVQCASWAVVVWRWVRLTARITSRVTATAAAATRTKVHHGEPLCTIVVVGALAGVCGAAVVKALPSSTGAGAAAAIAAVPISPTTVPTVARTVVIRRRMAVMAGLLRGGPPVFAAGGGVPCP